MHALISIAKRYLNKPAGRIVANSQIVETTRARLVLRRRLSIPRHDTGGKKASKKLMPATHIDCSSILLAIFLRNLYTCWRSQGQNQTESVKEMCQMDPMELK